MREEYSLCSKKRHSIIFRTNQHTEIDHTKNQQVASPPASEHQPPEVSPTRDQPTFGQQQDRKATESSMASLANRFRRQAELTLKDEALNPGNFKLVDVGANTMKFADADDEEDTFFILTILDHNGNFEISTDNVILDGSWLKQMNQYCRQGKQNIQDVISLASKQYYQILMNADDDDGGNDDIDADDDGNDNAIDEDGGDHGQNGHHKKDDENNELLEDDDEEDDEEEDIIIDEDEMEKRELPIHQIIKTELESWIKSFKWRREQEQKAIRRDQKLLEIQYENMGKMLQRKPQLDVELIEIKPDHRMISMALNKQLFKIMYPMDYNPARGQHLFVQTDSNELADVVKRLNTYLNKKASSLYAPNVALSVLLNKLLEIYIEIKFIEPMTPMSKESAKDDIFGISVQEEMVDDDHDMEDGDREQKDIETMYSEAWGSATSVTGPYSQESKQALMKQLQNCIKRNGLDGWEVELFEDNPFIWRIRLFDFPKDCDLECDLELFDEKYNLGKDVIIEMKFTGQYPNDPPSVRVVRPRMVYLSGNLSFGGTFCLDFLMPQNWSKYTYLDMLITQIKKSLIDNGARVDLRTCLEYDEKQAIDTFIRSRYANSIQFPTVNKYSEKLLAFSSTFAKNTYAIPFNQNALEKGNKVLLPLSAADRIFQSEFQLPLIFELKSNRNVKLYAGVSEFTAPEGNVIIPQWLLKSLFATEGQKIGVRCVTLPQGTYMKLQPHSKEFYEIEDHKTVLEETLLHYSCVTEGQSIPVYYNKKEYLVEIIELKPERACSLIADKGYLEVEIDFAPAVDLIDDITLIEMQEKQRNYRKMIFKKKVEKCIKEAQRRRQDKVARVKKVLDEATRYDTKELANIRFKFPNGVTNHEIALPRTTPTQILYEYVETLDDPSIYVCKPYTQGVDLELTTQYQVGSSISKFTIPNSFVDNLEAAGLYPRGMVLVSEHDRFPSLVVSPNV